MAELIELLPANYKNSQEVVELQEALGNHIAAATAAKADVFKQLDVNTATWGLSYWEQAYGIKTDILKSYDYRRTRLLSKMRGQGSTTSAMIKNAAESFSNGEVEIAEDNANYQFTVKFIGAKGIPPNLDDLKDAVEEIKPAHLKAIYEFTYLVWYELDAKNWTWDQLDAQDLTWNELEVLS